MTCQEIVELVTDYLERALDSETAAIFEEHINFCDGCEAYVGRCAPRSRPSAAIEPEDLPAATLTGLLAASGSGSARDRLQVPAPRGHDGLLPFRWPLPGDGPGAVGGGGGRPCCSGIHACRPGDLSYWVGQTLYEIELGGEIVEERTR